jgi:hypothetical protein
VAAAAVAACDAPTAENIERWRTTQKGPAKLAAALADRELAADLRARAAHNLVILDRASDVRAAIGALPDRQRIELMGFLATRLWTTARFPAGAGALAMPSADQTDAKDALFELRALAGPETREHIDGWLIEWLTGGYYDGRAREGRVSGRQIVRAAGPAAAAPLLEVARAVHARPAEADGTRQRLGDELLVALALSGDPAALGFLLDLATGGPKAHEDATLGSRAMRGLRDAVLGAQGVAPLAAAAVLRPVLGRLAAVLARGDLPGATIDDAADLVAAVGPPDCVPPFVAMIRAAGAREAAMWVGTQKGIRCGGAAAVGDLLAAVPTRRGLDRARLELHVWREIRALPAPAPAEVARSLVGAPGVVARVTGVELLGALAQPATAAEDARLVAGLVEDPAVLPGWPAAGGTGEPTLGQLAAKVSMNLQDLAEKAGIK